MSAVLFVAMMMVQTNGNMNTSRATIRTVCSAIPRHR